MALRQSHQLIEILRSTLAKLENDPSVESSNEELARLKRVLLRRIAEAQATDIPNDEPTSMPVVETPTSPVPPAKKAIELALALISDPPTAQTDKQDDPDLRIQLEPGH